jgi:hypothetical protein
MRFLSIFLVLAGCDPGSGNAVGGGKRVFVTSGRFNGSQVKGVCGRAATAAHLGGAWTEWLSMAGHDAIDNVTGAGPWLRLDGQVVFENHAGLAARPLANIDIDENGSKLVNELTVWTGTEIGGRLSSGFNCDNWENASYVTNGAIGYTGHTSSWTNGTVANCDGKGSVYCFEL